MKKLFRFFRGELNGAYIQAMLQRDEAMPDLIAELVYQLLMVWKTEDELDTGEIAIRSEDLFMIARFAGILQPIQYIETNIGSIRFTESEIVGGKERSERGLFSMITEGFDFYHTANDDYAEDIATLASESLRISFVPEGTVPLGYVAYGTDIFDTEGNLIPENLLSEPPIDGTPYTEYYGPSFLTLQEIFHNDVGMPIDMFKAYYECIRRIIRGSASLSELLYITNVLGDGYIYDIELVPEDYYMKLYYSLSTESTIENKDGRLATWMRVMEKQCKDIVIVEREVV